jgi:hypothetical protein
MESFIKELEVLFIQKDPLIAKIASPEAFLKSLRELNSLVEMYEAKESLIKQIKFILTSLATNGQMPQHMMHTLIYGPPGVGKTQLGIGLAKVWQAMGLLSGQAGTSIDRSKDKTGQIRQLEELLKNRDKTIAELKGRAQVHLDLIESCYRNIQNLEHTRSTKKKYQYIDLILDNLRAIRDELREGEKKILPTPQNPIVIASRADIVGEYHGHSGPKTRSFFEANRGRVIFIDEAYTLILDEKDTFGFEAVTELNKLMSEYPDTIVQLAGYKEHMIKTLFSPTIGQPGLERRFAWTFEIPGYSNKGLAAILQYQLAKESWSLAQDVVLETFLEAHKEHFTAYGGDTEKLAFYAKLAYSDIRYRKSILGDTSALPEQTLTQEMLCSGFEELKKNKVVTKEVSSLPLSLYM